MSKKEDLQKEFAGVTKRVSKKKIPNIQENEKITKKVYKNEAKKVQESTVTKSKKTTIDLPEDIHFKAKMCAMEDHISFKKYILNLVMDDLSKRKKI